MEFTGAVSHWFGLRATLDLYDHARTLNEEGITYDGTVKLGGYGVLADVYPSDTQFRLTVGLLKNRNRLDVTSTPMSDTTIGDNMYTPAQVGTLTGDMTFRSAVPYFGLGYGNAATSKRRIGFICDLGDHRGARSCVRPLLTMSLPSIVHWG